MSVATRSRAIVGRLAQIGLGLLLGLLFIELILQVGSLFTASIRGGQYDGVLAPGRRLACFGDSNTFGLGVGRPRSYPNVLSGRWKAAPADQRIEVVNLGMPGLNSSKLRQQFRGMVATILPDTVTIMIGVNDPWTVPVPLYGQDQNWHYRLWTASRAYRFLYMLSKAWQNPRRAVELQYTPDGLVMQLTDDVGLTWTGKRQAAALHGWLGGLRQNLQAIISDARTAGIEPVLLTYPFDWELYGTVNGVIREIAALTQTRLIDLGAQFRLVCPSGQCPELFLPDQHPTVLGHQRAADILWQAFSPAGDADSAAPTQDTSSTSR